MGRYFSHQSENLTGSCQHIYFNNDVCMHATCIYICMHAACMHVCIHILVNNLDAWIDLHRHTHRHEQYNVCMYASVVYTQSV